MEGSVIKSKRVRKVRGPNKMCDDTLPEHIPDRIWKQYPLVKGRGKNNEYMYVAPQEYSDGYSHYQLQLYPRKTKGGTSNRLKHVGNFKDAKVAALYFSVIKKKKLDVSDLPGATIAKLARNIIQESPVETSEFKYSCSLKRMHYNIIVYNLTDVLLNPII